MHDLIEKAKLIKCLICDVDGVLTDGLNHMDDNGVETKTFHIQDGLGLKLLMNAGIDVAIITGSVNPLIDARMRQLGINHYFKGQMDKRGAFEQLKNTLKINNENFAYIGDDLPDLFVMRQVGLAVAPANAVRQIKEFATWQTEQPGGKGAVRELCDLILDAQNKLDLALEKFLKQ